MSHYDAVLSAVMLDGAKKATYFMTSRFTIKATRRGKLRKRDKTVEVLVTAGAPNYAERQRIKKMAKSKEKFPLLVIKY